MSVRSDRLIGALALGVLLACIPGGIGCDRKGRDGGESDGQRVSVVERVFEEGEKGAGRVTKVCKKVFADCEFEDGSKQDDEVSLRFTAALDAGTASRLGVHPKVVLDVTITKHGSSSEAREAEKKFDADGCFVRSDVPGKPLTIAFACGADSARACCERDIKEKFDSMRIDLTLM